MGGIARATRVWLRRVFRGPRGLVVGELLFRPRSKALKTGWIRNISAMCKMEQQERTKSVKLHYMNNLHGRATFCLGSIQISIAKCKPFNG